MKRDFDEAFISDGVASLTDHWHEPELAVSRTSSEESTHDDTLCVECKMIDFSLLQSQEALSSTGKPVSGPRTSLEPSCQLCKIVGELLEESFPSELWSVEGEGYHWRLLPHF